ncbi:unknown [Eubacterium sp. CAG:581]|nr:unknown [Eubacterium sp. CAG:581]
MFEEPFLRAVTLTVLPDLILEAETLTTFFLELETVIALLYVFEGETVALMFTDLPFFCSEIDFLTFTVTFLAF